MNTEEQWDTHLNLNPNAYNEKSISFWAQLVTLCITIFATLRLVDIIK